MDLVQTVAPSSEPVTLIEFNRHLRADSDCDAGGEGQYKIDIITTARAEIEDRLSRQIMTATWVAYMDEFPGDDFIVLPFGNLQSVTSVKYKNSSGTETTMTVSSEYIVETNGNQCGRIVLPYGKTWPSFTAYTSHPIAITFVAGWTSSSSVPYQIKAAIKLVAADLYANREQQIVSMHEFQHNETVDRLCSSWKLWNEF
jgi:uncharacterized phiE125 gp8 family phage protein